MSAAPNVIDISLTVRTEMPFWPNSEGFRIRRTREIAAGDTANVSLITSDVHVGTHVDAPLHFLEGGGTVDQLPLGVLIGPARVVYLPDTEAITAEVLQSLALPPDTRRLLFRTRNSRLWAEGVTTFREDYVGLTLDGAQWIVEHGIALVGNDYLSVQRYHDTPEIHRVLLRAGVVLLEGLNLDGVAPGLYELICLPIKLGGAEGAPARAILRPLPEEG